MDVGPIATTLFAMAGAVIVYALVYFVWLDGHSPRLALAVTAVFAAGAVVSLLGVDVSPYAASLAPWVAMGVAVLLVRRFGTRPA